MSTTYSRDKWRHLATETASTALVITDESLTIQWSNEASKFLLGSGLKPSVRITDFIEHSEYLLRAIIGEVHERRRCVLNQTTVTPPLQNDGFTALVIATPIFEPNVSYTLVEIIQNDNIQMHSVHGSNNSDDALSIVRHLAHEIKNPLSGIKGAAQLMGPSEENDEIQQIIVQEVNRLSSIMDRLLYGKANNLHEIRLNIHKPLEHVLRIIEPSQTRIKIIRDYDPSIPDIRGDEDLLIQLYLNLCQNAMEAIDDKGELQLRTRIEHNVIIGKFTHRQVARIDIIDTGSGILPALQNKIFIPMVSGRDGGTGLGLSICMDIVNAHKGLLTFKSKPGKTQFSIFLPIIK